jgi:hypothetical protein
VVSDRERLGVDVIVVGEDSRGHGVVRLIGEAEWAEDIALHPADLLGYRKPAGEGWLVRDGRIDVR